MKIVVAETEQAIAACFPVMFELRPHLIQETFVERIRQQQSQGYRLAYLELTGEPTGEVSGQPVALAGFRISNNLAWGKFLYVDDLVTSAKHRSHGYGKALLNWLNEYAIQEGCSQLHLDSGVQRKEAHRFYQREQVIVTGFHFARNLK
ncbi:Histone acetyltransferase HPA2 and related acetyltransferases [hydrothermal vent metagenome]|uniref:Histone acetyltransferase HPA2 and related acetyltransferases n=1 Tax=hydrothermal vent metagenome TaxID=652676 RepID=A0A3B0YUF0_9ZZZZ